MARRIAYIVLIAACFLFAPGIAHSGDKAQADHPTTPNEFLNKGKLTFIFGTGGTRRSDAFIRTEARFIRDTLFPDADLLPDTAVDIGKGPAGWPENPIIYGGPHVNRVMTALRDDLPFLINPGELIISDLKLKGDEYGVIAVVPANDEHPEFLVYAGTGTPGVAGINSVWHGNEPVLVTDRFGRYLSGTYKHSAPGKNDVYFPPQEPVRAHWITMREAVPAASGRESEVNVHRTADMQMTNTLSQVVKSVDDGAARALKRLGIDNPDPIDIYLYADKYIKEKITNNAGHGHSVVMANTVHLIMIDPRLDGPMEDLAAHEVTHVYAYQKWGPPGSALLGEGLAVWAAGSYAGYSLQQWAASMPAPPPATALMDSSFSSLPERQAYPLAGLFVTAAIMTVGQEKFMKYLYPATASTWEEDCKRAGTTAETIQETFAALFGQ